ncbi:hypothetical protein ACW9HQ_40685, partial [Nocardia gipuzkoensis]
MNSTNSTAITRMGPTLWHAVAEDRVVGRGEASRRPDGRVFLSIDSWRDTDFDRLAAAMLPELSTPVYTVVDEVDTDLRTAWERAGFTVRRREWEYFAAIGPQPDSIPADVTILPLGAAEPEPLRSAYATIRAEIDATLGWDRMPDEVVGCPDGTMAIDPARCAVAM